MRTAIALATLALFTTSAMATDYYVVQNTRTKKCTIVTKKPTSKTTVAVGPTGVTYTTRSEAEAGMKKIKVCESH